VPPAGEEDEEEEGPPEVVAPDEDAFCFQCATKSAFFTDARLRLVRGSGSVSSNGLLRTVGHVVQHRLSPLPLNCVLASRNVNNHCL
jgi:hypothetical protein